MSDNFTPIPDYPGYSINDRGQVMGKAGRLLSHDAQGTVQLVQGKAKRRVFPGELLSLAGWRAPDATGQSVDQAAEASIAELKALQARCKAAETLAKKLEAQRDALAAKLLVMQVELADAKARAKIASGRRAIGRAYLIPEDW